jgi:hypothetical protein
MPGLLICFSGWRTLLDVRSDKNTHKKPVQKVFIQIHKKRRIPAVLSPKQWVKVAHITKISEDHWVFPSEEAKQ